MKRNACERQYRRGELLLDSLVLVLLAFMKDKKLSKSISLTITRSEPLKELTEHRVGLYPQLYRWVTE